MKTTHDQLVICARPRQRGYVLLCAIAVLLLGAVILVGMTRWSLSRIVLANEAQEQLQLKWGTISSKRAILPQAEEILLAAEQAGQPTASVRAQIPLGKQSFTVIIGDEQAKANPNLGIRFSRPSEVEQAIRVALRGTGLASHVRLSVPASANPWPIGSYNQVFRDLPVERLLEHPRAGVGAADLITCWSDGKINIARASEASMQVALRPFLTNIEISDLVQARKKLLEKMAEAQAEGDAPSPEQSAQATTQASDNGSASAFASLTGTLSKEAQAMLTDSSRCHSLWVVAEAGELRKIELDVIDTTDREHPRYWSFTW